MAREATIRLVIQGDSQEDRTYFVKVPNEQLLEDEECAKFSLTENDFLSVSEHDSSSGAEIESSWKLLEDHRYAKMPLGSSSNPGRPSTPLQLSDWDNKKMSSWSAFEYLDDEDIAPLQHEFETFTQQESKFHHSLSESNRTEVLSENSQKLRLKFGLRTKIKRKHFFDDSDDETCPSKSVSNVNLRSIPAKKKSYTNKQKQGKEYTSDSEFEKRHVKQNIKKKIIKTLQTKIQSKKLCPTVKKQRFYKDTKESVKGIITSEKSCHKMLSTKLCRKKGKAKYFSKTFSSISLDNVVSTKRRARGSFIPKSAS